MSARLEFSDKTKREAYALRDGMCPGLVEIRTVCGRDLSRRVEYDHVMRNEIKPDNSLENCRPLCPDCHRLKSNLDAKCAKKGRKIRGETKKSQRPKAKIRSRGFSTPEERRRIKLKYGTLERRS
jgi:5-methylcytosine-specific restriction endonuclease McrA